MCTVSKSGSFLPDCESTTSTLLIMDINDASVHLWSRVCLAGLVGVAASCCSSFSCAPLCPHMSSRSPTGARLHFVALVQPQFGYMRPKDAVSVLAESGQGLRKQ